MNQPFAECKRVFHVTNFYSKFLKTSLLGIIEHGLKNGLKNYQTIESNFTLRLNAAECINFVPRNATNKNYPKLNLKKSQRDAYG